MKQFNLEEYIKNPSKKVITRDGRKVTRILCTDAKGKYPIIALIWIHGEERVYSFTKNGCWNESGEESVNDLFFVSEKHKGWVNIFKGEHFYNTGDTFVYKSKKDAEKQGKDFSDYIATVKIEWEEQI